jgi:ABC-type antimicrobial peptide transport system permease subunit
MSPSQYSFYTTVLLGPVAALVGGIVVVLVTQGFVVGVIAGITGVVVGLVASYVFAVIWMNKWPTEYDPVDPQTYERSLREYEEWESKRHSRIEEMAVTAFFWTLFFSGTITALVVTLLVGWLLSG